MNPRINPRIALILSSTGLGLFYAGCEQKTDTPPATARESSNDTNPRIADPAVKKADGEPATKTPAPDNTAVNKVDRDSTTKTPFDQSNTKADIDITAGIRRAIMDDKSMSMNAQNCKIVTAAGVTTLRGPVASQAEKDAIEAKAKAIAGVTRVDNQLEVKTK